MLDENGTEATRPDGPSPDESLFGDAADDTAAAAVEEEDSKGQTAQDPQGSDDAEEQAVGDETGSSEDLKVVVSLKGGRATIGVQRPASDPHIESFDDADLSGLTQEVSAVIERARAKWEDEPKHPAHARPAPQARRQPRRGQGSAQAEAAEGGAEQQQPETLNAATGGGRRNGDGFPLPSHVCGLVCWFWCVTITSLRWIGVRQTDAALVVVDRKKARVAAPPTG